MMENTQRAKEFRTILSKRLGKETTPIRANDTLLRLWNEFSFECEGSHRTEMTIKSYEKHFHKLCEFVGYISMVEDGRVVDYKSTRKECRAIGETYPIEVLDTPQISAHFHRYLEEVCCLSDQTVMTCMRNFRRFVYWAIEHDLIEGEKVKVPNIEPPIKETFKQEEIRRLTSRMPSVDDMVGYRCWVMIMYLLDTGNRIGSVLELNVEDVDFEENRVAVNFTKNRQPQYLSISDKLKRHLARWIKTYREVDGIPLYGQPLFPNLFGERMTYDGCSDAMADYFRLHGVKWTGFHKFRHTYASNWIKTGGDSLTLKAQLGHKSLTMTNRYANLYGTAVAEEAREHSLMNKVDIRSGRKALKPNK